MDGLTTGGLLMAGIGLCSGIMGKIVFDWLKGGRGGSENGNGHKMPGECRETLKRIEGGVASIKGSQEQSHDREVESAVILRQINETIKEQTKVLQQSNTLLQVATGGGGGRATRVLD